MSCVALTVVHSVNGRLRLKLSHKLKDFQSAFEFTSQKGGINEFRYNATIKTLLIEYNALQIDENEILVRFGVEYCRQTKAKHIKVMYPQKKDSSIPTIGYVSLLFIFANLGVQWIGLGPISRNLMKWFSVTTTVGAIFEHGYKELNEKGAFDPEVMSIMYLIDSINKGKTTYSSAIAWAITFGRHVLQKQENDMLLTINYYNQEDTGEKLYHVNISPLVNQNHRLDFLNKFLNRYIESYPKPRFKQEYMGNMAKRNVFPDCYHCSDRKSQIMITSKGNSSINI
jgi:hypothetical protein